MANFVRQVPEGDDRERNVCGTCGFVAYENPKIVVGSVVAEGESLLLCRRAIEPRRGYWTLPAGYLEHGETTEDGARREAWEEARARIGLDGLLGVYSIARIGQVQLIYRAHLAVPGFEPGPESLDVRLFPWAELPWRDLAFPTVAWSLRYWHESRGRALAQPFGNAPTDPRGVRPLGADPAA